MKRIIFIGMAFTLGFITCMILSAYKSSDLERDISNLKHECLKYNDDKEECANLAIDSVYKDTINNTNN